MWGSLIVVMYPDCCDIALMLWSSLIVVRQPHCCEVASMFWHSLFVVGQPLCCEIFLFLWGSLIVLRQPEFCEVASLLWGWLNILRQPQCCEGTLREPHFIFSMFSAWIFSFRVPQSPHSGSASTLAVLATFYDSGDGQYPGHGEVFLESRTDWQTKLLQV